MLTAILVLASHVDVWLRQRLGYFYELILSTGLSLSIVATVKSIGDAWAAHAAGAPGDIAKMLAVIAFEVALLINQLAQVNERREARRQRRAARREAVKS
jgi:hypothetical protein